MRKRRPALESQVLAAALKQSIDCGDRQGAKLAYKELSLLLKQAEDATSKNELVAGSAQPIDTEAKESDTHRATQELEKDIPVQQVKLAGSTTELPEAQTDSQPETAFAPDNGLTEYAGSLEPAPDILAEDETGPLGHKSDLKIDRSGEALSTNVDPTLTAAPTSAVQPIDPEKAEPVITAVTAYDLFETDEMSSIEEIHIKFLRCIHKLLRRGVRHGDMSMRDFKEQLRALCIAHDILRDPVTRTDYDFRRLGVRHENHVQTPEEDSPKSLGNRTPLKIGELLECSKILEPPELEIAVDMHKAMPEMMFGQFLVKQGFLSFEVLDSALLGQRLIQAGKITVGQFQAAMLELSQQGESLGQVLLNRQWIQAEDLQAYNQAVSSKEEEILPAARTIIEPRITTEAIAPPPISATNAVPSWAGQLSWEEEPEGQEVITSPLAEPDGQNQTQVSSDIAEDPAVKAQDSLPDDSKPAPAEELLSITIDDCCEQVDSRSTSPLTVQSTPELNVPGISDDDVQRLETVVGALQDEPGIEPQASFDTEPEFTRLEPVLGHLQAEIPLLEPVKTTHSKKKSKVPKPEPSRSSDFDDDME